MERHFENVCSFLHRVSHLLIKRCRGSIRLFCWTKERKPEKPWNNMVSIRPSSSSSSSSRSRSSFMKWLQQKPCIWFGFASLAIALSCCLLFLTFSSDSISPMNYSYYSSSAVDSSHRHGSLLFWSQTTTNMDTATAPTSRNGSTSSSGGSSSSNNVDEGEEESDQLPPPEQLAVVQQQTESTISHNTSQGIVPLHLGAHMSTFRGIPVEVLPSLIWLPNPTLRQIRQEVATYHAALASKGKTKQPTPPVERLYYINLEHNPNRRAFMEEWLSNSSTKTVQLRQVQQESPPPPPPPEKQQKNHSKKRKRNTILYERIPGLCSKLM